MTWASSAALYLQSMYHITHLPYHILFSKSPISMPSAVRKGVSIFVLQVFSKHGLEERNCKHDPNYFSPAC